MLTKEEYVMKKIKGRPKNCTNPPGEKACNKKRAKGKSFDCKNCEAVKK